ncbi:hypothetical protein PHET_08660 [Paragonimus heterotremus]|uniref:Uncharacterized protein n=1 Tax=Paragonimus heterotremus TaxID=100268 RepID=A0A8J4SZF4_9TREM|nr:hypothetical protein PHET_08660 [Paragonimus heterotremus]
MHKQPTAYNNPSISEQREYVKLQYGRKIAQDTCMLASVKTPDWSQSPPGLIGRHNAVPCTVTTNSSNSNLKMYPYSVYSDTQRCQKLRSGCIRHRCLSGSALQVLLPSTGQEAVGLQPMGRSNVGHPVALSSLFIQPPVTKLTSGRPTSGRLYYHHPSAIHQHSYSHHPVSQLHIHQPIDSCLQNHTFVVGAQHLLSNLGVQPLSNPPSRGFLHPELIQR